MGELVVREALRVKVLQQLRVPFDEQSKLLQVVCLLVLHSANNITNG
jgi:hypothetical protein